jgi:cell division protease FtsH
VTYGPRPEARFLRTPFGLDGERTYSEETARAIDADVRGIIAGEHRRAHELLDRRREVLERIAQELLMKETLERGELEELARRVRVDGREPVPR